MIIGSLNGHAYEDLRDLPAAKASGAIACPVIIGGNLSVGSRKNPHIYERLYRLGVDRIVADAGHLIRHLDDLAQHHQEPTRTVETS